MIRLLPLSLAVLFLACPGGTPGTDGGKGGGAGGGAGGGTGQGPYAITVLDADAGPAPYPTYTAMAVDPVAERVGVAWFAPTGTVTHSGHPDFEVRYAEVTAAGATTPVKVGGIVQRRVGLSLAFDPLSHEPTIGLLGGDQGFVPGQSIFWFQSDAVLRRRTLGTWADSTIAVTGDQTVCGNPVSDRGFLVGLWSTVFFDSTGKLYYAWRDGHDGEFDKQDWGGSDIELAENAQAALTRVCVKAGGNDKQGWGGHLQLAMGPGDQPALISDQMSGGADTVGSNVIFQKRTAAGAWTTPASIFTIADTQSGPSLAWDSQEGYGVTVFDRSLGQLRYLNSALGTVWSAPDEVVGAGSSGWYPSLAMDPVNHEPAIAYYHCSPRAGATEATCLPDEDELRITQRIAGTWRDQTVDAAGGYAPKLAFFASGKRVVSYRDPSTGAVKVAVER